MKVKLALTAQELDIFLKDLLSHLHEIENSLVSLEQDTNREASIEQLFRSFHTIKGNAGIADFMLLNQFAHEIESVLSKYRGNTNPIPTQFLDLLFRALDGMNSMHQAIINPKKDFDDREVSALINDFKNFMPAQTLAPSVPSQPDISNNALEAGGITIHIQAEEPMPAVRMFQVLQVFNEHKISFHSNPTRKEIESGAAQSPLMIFLEQDIPAEQLQALTQLIERMDGIQNVALPEPIPIDIDAGSLLIQLKPEEPLPAVRMFQVLQALDELRIAFRSNPSRQEIEGGTAQPPLTIFLNRDIPAEQLQSLVERIHGTDGIVKVDWSPHATQTQIIEEPPPAVPVQAPVTQEEAQEVQINIKKLDSLINLLGEILIDRNKIAQNILKLEEEYTLNPHVVELLSLVNHLGQITYHLQTELLNIRTIPLSNIVEKYPRLIRDLARKLGKKVRLDIVGQQVELDRMILRHLNDMMIHLIRNAIDHGIEEPAVRISNRKKEMGLIRIEAYQKHDKATFVVSDDGKGIDPDIIRKSLIKKELVTPAIAKSLSDTEVINYIFHPGFSTKDAVSDISGRGVGMDVVQNKVQKLGGHITVDSTLGQGTHFRISLPLTMAIIHGLVTLCQKHTFIIPISFVDEVVRCSGKETRFINKKPHILLRENLIPLVNLGELLYGKELDIRVQKKLFIVVVNYNDELTGILVDKLLGEEEIVIKNIDSASSKYYIIQSATIMGTGEIGLILDVAALMNLVSQHESKQTEEAESVYEHTHR